MAPDPTPALTEFERVLLAALADAPEGLTRRELERRADLSHLSASTLRRALTDLADRGLLRAHGETRARRYRATTQPPPDAARDDADIPLSAEAEALRLQVHRPLAQRTPAGFHRAFLDAYRPGETFYLPAPTRERLAAIGHTGAAPQPGGTYARQILERLLIDLSWNSSRLEGNTYSLLDTKRLLLEGTAAAGKDLSERQMLINHKAAIEWLVESVGDPAPLRLHAGTLRNLHALLAQNLLGDPADEGRVRARPVQIHGSTFIPLAVPQQIEECLTQVALTADAIADPFELSFFLLVHIPYLQPFVDGNKRTARLAANLPFIRDNLRPLTFTDVPQRRLTDALLAVYELRRVELLRDLFTWAYERSAARYAAVQQSFGEPDPFRLLHRPLIKEAVAALVRAGHGPEDMGTAVAPFAARLAAADRPRFLAVIEAELRGLHDGNYARYSLRLSEFEAWAQRAAGAPPRP